MTPRHFKRSGWSVSVSDNGRCHDSSATILFCQTLWRWSCNGDPVGMGTVLLDAESPCPHCLAERVETLLGDVWGLTGERFTKYPTQLD